MSQLAKKLEELGLDSAPSVPWKMGAYEEKEIIKLIVDEPNSVKDYMEYVRAELFAVPECQFLAAVIKNYWDDFGCVPTRPMVHDIVAKRFTADDDSGEKILEIIKACPDIRATHHIRKSLFQWIRHVAYSKLFTPEIINAVNSGDYEEVEKIIAYASSITENQVKIEAPLDILELILANPEDDVHFTTGVKWMDKSINGGPQRKQVLCWVAPTNQGKTLYLVLSAVMNAIAGRNVMFITFETDSKAIVRRMIAAIAKRLQHHIRFGAPETEAALFRAAAEKLSGKLKIIELPPDSYNAKSLQSIVEKSNFKADVVCIDYMDLMISNSSFRREDKVYEIQKQIATQIRALAFVLDACVITATQTNREGYKAPKDGGAEIDLSHLSDSYGKAMPLDYLVSINPNMPQCSTPGTRFLVLKVIKSRHSSSGGRVLVKTDFGSCQLLELAADDAPGFFHDVPADVAAAWNNLVHGSMIEAKAKKAKALAKSQAAAEAAEEITSGSTGEEGFKL